MTYTIQTSSRTNRAITPHEINQDLIPLIRTITKDDGNRVDLMKCKDDLIYYLNGSEIPGASFVVMLLKKNDKVVLTLNS